MKRTKIVATISDKRCDVDFLQELYQAGMDVVRLNTAHQTLDDAMKVIRNVRAVSEKIPLLIDTKGPEVRTKQVTVPIEVEKGEVIYITGKEEVVSDEKLLHVSYENFTQDIKIGDKILVDDGDMEFIVQGKYEDRLEVMATNPGFIKDKKSVNVPGASMKLQSLSEKDRRFIEFAIENHLDFIAHSFVRNKEDVLQIQEILDQYKSDIKIIAKIENQEGVDNIDEILDHVYGVMVARGDLAIEIDAEKIPKIQRCIVTKCIESKKPVIIATQMLHTMIEHPRPTRAEVSDIANAIFMGTDAIMLSGETAYGSYPVEAVEVMTKVAEANELTTPPDSGRSLVRINNEITAALARVAVKTTTMLPIKAIVVDTLSGRTARYLSAFRGALPVYARCYNPKVMRELALSFGIRPYHTEKPTSRDEFIRDIPDVLLKAGYQEEDYILVIGGSFGYVRGASFMEICKISDIK
ncbi:pyruvate kinase [Odoribacter laneus]|jgi:pyruvate kinase|uniref:pyruvate kinase n=1 Tax=Odoribacter laneus TaxID=626933 RepID=UPI0018996763|nr:pyruvate kinase [Odoribacter laneus]GKI20726.1 pyruvate kinase [Odoribacter laneus]GKI23990.1 pyruvate kinase [Odoribacter laneus]